jgi:hypothetical protein
MAACIKAMTHVNSMQFFTKKFKKFNERFSYSFCLGTRENLTKIALKLAKYLSRTYLSPSTLPTPCAPDSKHNNAFYLPPALILPLRCRHGAGLRTERGGLQTKTNFLTPRGCLWRARSVFELTLALALGLALAFVVSWSPSGSQLTDVGSKSVRLRHVRYE